MGTKGLGAVLYRGPSLIDGSPIVCVATYKTSNRKTGAMVQTWILPADVEPHESVKTGADESVCGRCPHRPLLAKETGEAPCYVTTFQAPLSVWRAEKRGIYDERCGAFGRRSVGRNKAVRLGAWGDPYAVPVAVWRDLTAEARMWTAYTHQWRSPGAEALQRFCMASVDSVEEYHEAKARGWKCFRVTDADGMPLAGEIACPASKEAGNLTTCERCKLCQGTAHKGKDIVIRAH